MVPFFMLIESWDNHLSVTWQGGLNPPGQTRQTGFEIPPTANFKALPSCTVQLVEACVRLQNEQTLFEDDDRCISDFVREDVVTVTHLLGRGRGLKWCGEMMKEELFKGEVGNYL